MVISNHEDYRGMVEREKIPFHCLPVSDDKASTFRRIAGLWEEARADLIVLARICRSFPRIFARTGPAAHEYSS